MAKLAVLSLFTELPCRGGARLAVVRKVLAAKETRRLSGDWQMTFTLPVTDPAFAHLRERRVVVAELKDGTVDDWRVTAISEQHQTESGLTVDVTCAHATQDLGEDALVGRVEASGEVRHDFEALQLSPAIILERFLVASLVREGLTHWSVGVIEATETVDLVFKHDTVLAALLRLADLSHTEFRIRRNGVVGYYLDLLTAIGSDAPKVDFRLGKNLRGIKRDRSTEDFGTRIYPFGTETEGVAATCAENVWQIAAIVPAGGPNGGDLLDLVDFAGFEGPVLEDDQLNGFSLFFFCGATAHEVTATLVAGQQVEVEAGSLLAVGDRVGFRRTDAGERLTFCESPSMVAAYGRKVLTLPRPDLPDTINLIENPAMRVWDPRASDEPPPKWGMVWSDGTASFEFGIELAMGPGYGEDYGGGYG